MAVARSFPTNPAYPVPCEHWDADGDGRLDLATDIFAPVGTDALAVFDGVVSVYWTQQGGHTIGIRSPDGWIAHYGHLDSVAVGHGATVRAGQVIGKTGCTGSLCRDPHLHFAVGTSLTAMGAGTVRPCDWLAGVGPAVPEGQPAAEQPRRVGITGLLVAFGVGYAVWSLVEEL